MPHSRDCLAIVAFMLAGCASAPPEPHAAPPSAGARVGAGVVDAGSPAPAASSSSAGVKRTPSEIISFRLHKFAAPVGFERDTYTKADDGSVEAKASFTFQDRGTHVPLAASYVLGPDGTPRHYEAWGNQARQALLDERIVAEGGDVFSVWSLGQPKVRTRIAGPVVLAKGYAPVLGQDLMLRAWGARGRPATMALVPEGTISFESRGKETLEAEGKRITVEHVSVRGLVWGREDVWIDESGKLVAVVTRDAEFDHFEAVRDDSVGLLPALMSRAGRDGVAWLAEVGKTALRPTPKLVALVGAQLVDGTGRAPVKDAVVVYDGDKIVAVGPRGSTVIPAGAATVDVSGKTILPGLWDMHAHVEQVEQNAAYLAAGVTTVRDMGNILEFATGVRDAVASGKGLGPDVIVDGLVDGDGSSALGVDRIKTKEDIVPMLDRLQRAGCPEVKIYAHIAPALVKPIAVEAHRRGMRVVGHIPDGMDIVQALEAGFDGVSHIAHFFDLFFAPGEKRKLSFIGRMDRIIQADLSGPVMQRTIRTFLAKKAFVDETLALYELFHHTPEENAQREPGIAKLPRELRGQLDGPPADAQSERRAKVFDKFLALVRELHRQGVPLVVGSDQSILGHSVHREIELYVQAGFTPLEAISAATSLPARIMKMDAQVGTIAVGKRADLVVVAGDPVTNIRDVRKIAAVVARGRTYDPASLWRIAGFTP